MGKEMTIQFTYDELQAVRRAVWGDLRRMKESRQSAASLKENEYPTDLDLEKLVALYDADIQLLEAAYTKLKEAGLCGN